MSKNNTPDGELALVEEIMYGVAQVQLFPSGERTKLILPQRNQVKIGGIYSINTDHDRLIVE